MFGCTTRSGPHRSSAASRAATELDARLGNRLHGKSRLMLGLFRQEPLDD